MLILVARRRDPCTGTDYICSAAPNMLWNLARRRLSFGLLAPVACSWRGWFDEESLERANEDKVF